MFSPLRFRWTTFIKVFRDDSRRYAFVGLPIMEELVTIIVLRCYSALMLLMVLASYATATQRDSKNASGKESPPVNPMITRVKVGSSNAVLDSAVSIPVYFTLAEGVEVGSLKVQVTFVSVNMKFKKLQPGLAAQMGNVDLKSSVTMGKNEKGVETSTVTVEASVPSSQPKGVPTGVLAYLTLQISPNARSAKISLRTSAEATEVGSNKPLKDLQTADATVEVDAPGEVPQVGCFFFSH